MNDLRTAAQQALEAMEQLAVLAEYGTTGPGKCDSSPLNQKQATSLRLAISDISRAQISTLRAALAEPVQEHTRKPLTEEEIVVLFNKLMRCRPAWPERRYMDFARYVERAHGIGERIKQDKQRKPLTDEEIDQEYKKGYADGYAAGYDNGDSEGFTRGTDSMVPASLAAWRAETKPLTEDEIYAAIKGIDSLRAVEVARAIERAHGIGDDK